MERRTYGTTRNGFAASVTIDDLVSEHERYHRENTRGVNHALLEHLKAFFGKTPTLNDITDDSCIAFSQFIAGKVHPSSVKTYLQKLHAMLDDAVQNRYIEKNPMPSIKDLLPRSRQHHRTYLSMDELAKLTATPCRHSETKRAFLFACQTGLRLSDIETLVYEDIKVIGKVPTICKTQIKTGHEVRVPLNSIAQRLLGERGESGNVFELLSRSVISSDLNSWAKEAGINKRVTFHVSRHTFATLSIAAGVDIYVVSKLCGHTTIRTTEIYTHIIDTSLQKGVSMLGDTMMEHRAATALKSIATIPTKIKQMWNRFRQGGFIKNLIF